MSSISRETIEYLATEFWGDPPQPLARWYKVEAGSYARCADGEIDIYQTMDLKVEQSIGTIIEFVSGDGREDEIAAIRSRRPT